MIRAVRRWNENSVCTRACSKPFRVTLAAIMRHQDHLYEHLVGRLYLTTDVLSLQARSKASRLEVERHFMAETSHAEWLCV